MPVPVIHQIGQLLLSREMGPPGRWAPCRDVPPGGPSPWGSSLWGAHLCRGPSPWRPISQGTHLHGGPSPRGPSLREGRRGSEAPYTQLLLTFLTLQLPFLCHPVSLALQLWRRLGHCMPHPHLLFSRHSFTPAVGGAPGPGDWQRDK